MFQSCAETEELPQPGPKLSDVIPCNHYKRFAIRAELRTSGSFGCSSPYVFIKHMKHSSLSLGVIKDNRVEADRISLRLPLTEYLALTRKKPSTKPLVT